MRLLQNTLLLLGSVLVALLVGEIGARLLLSEPRVAVVNTAPDFDKKLADEARDPIEAHTSENPSQGPLYVHSQTGRRLRANAHVIIENHEVSERRTEIRTNSQGYRNPELRPSGKRILFLGDSITFGDFVDEGETYVRQVEAIAAERGLDWQAINAGVGGVALKNEIAILQETGLSTKPEAVVVGFYLNDFQESPGVYVPRLPSWLAQSELFTHIVFRLALLRSGSASLGNVFGLIEHDEIHKEDLIRWGKEFEASTPVGQGDFMTDEYAFNHMILWNFADWGGAFSPHVWEYLRPLFVELLRLSKEHRFELYVVAFPVRFQVQAPYLRDEPQRKLTEITADLGIPMLDLLPMLREAYQTAGPPLYYDHCHMTPHGYRLVAERVCELLDGR